MSKTEWRVGVAGLGTVGGGLLNFLSDRPGFAPAGGKAVVTGVSARSRSRPRPFDISNLPWFDDPVELAKSPDIDVFVELIGGSDGPAKAAVEAALHAGKPVVTANKALIAEHGAELAALAEAKGVPLLFEAAVMGGTPAVKMLREAMVGDDVKSVAGILNGTCNYILSEMDSGGRSFADVLAEAQRLGYAESDPTMDVGGFDAAHKISILAALAFGCAPNYAAAEIEGIDQVALLDIQLAKDLGYKIKLIASANSSDDGVLVRVHPTLVAQNHPLAQAGGALNALFIEGTRIGRIFIQGPGAGSGPTAAAVAADIADVMTGATRPVFQAPAQSLKPFTPVDPAKSMSRAYLRFLVKDEPGVIAAVSETLAEAGVSIESFLQKPVDNAEGVPIVLTTHAVAESVLTAAIDRIANLSAVLERPRLLRIARI
ncbi:homoserine dehydrogenase [Phenylobacterium sp. Root77]|jgi:homoserine dehydrogenase|uniref:homoserine dehydrogenase n=1 Tax=unclassified Phenylobacterium TaxID=2640670 RepID=UPI0006F67FA3|nr:MULTISPECIES: homoserine dehydrogenase [unclassified Phenylobacterium]KQW71661.1 homoserine dehydrogenase [Phenylobacterium sp. Root1277]KQW94581.1 homoserine dehydrogenase [Phenylobacterium sp. Root1290]KRC44274.1 homoserine dehydrogenase [Phenylobacterium sp. Root77]